MLYGHNKYCNCFECQPDHVDAIFAQQPFNNAETDTLLYANKPVILYGTSSTTKIYNTVPAGTLLGSVLDKGNGRIRTMRGWFKDDPATYISKVVAHEELTSEQKKEVLLNTAKALDQSGTVTVISDTSKGIENVVDFFGNYWKWILGSVIAIILLAIFLRIKG